MGPDRGRVFAMPGLRASAWPHGSKRRRQRKSEVRTRGFGTVFGVDDDVPAVSRTRLLPMKKRRPFQNPFRMKIGSHRLYEPGAREQVVELGMDRFMHSRPAQRVQRSLDRLFASTMKHVVVGAVAVVVGIAAVVGAADYRGVVGVDYSQDAGNTYICANPSGSPVTAQAGVSVSSPTLSLYNPIGSGKNLTVVDVGVVPAAANANTADIFLAYNITPSSGPSSTGFTLTAPDITTAVVAKSTGTLTTAVAKCQIQGVLPATPLAFRYLGTVSTNTYAGIYDATSGRVVVVPGATISIQATAAASILAHITWREDPQ